MMDFILLFANLVGWALKIYTWVHIIAFLLSWIDPDPHNSIVRFIRGATLPMWNFVRRHLPHAIQPFAPYLALMLVFFGEIALPGVIRSTGAGALGEIPLDQALMNSGFYLAIGFLWVIRSVVWFIFLVAAIWFAMTLVNPPMNHPLVRSLFYMIDPLITPIQRILPRTRIDLSPLVVAGISYLLIELLLGAIVPIQARLII